jgi:hypothetical protein
VCDGASVRLAVPESQHRTGGVTKLATDFLFDGFPWDGAYPNSLSTEGATGDQGKSDVAQTTQNVKNSSSPSAILMPSIS